MFKAILLMITAAFFVTPAAQASNDMFTKVSTYTLSGVERIKQSNSSAVTTVEVNISGYANAGKCNEAIAAIQMRSYPLAKGQIPAALSDFTGECHEVKEIIPVLTVVIPEQQPPAN
ncbi:MAG: hypothetical protein K2P74_06910 [Nitrosomonas sp.]|nr:hypothetical protein [Nitrosomonas sp.]